MVAEQERSGNPRRDTPKPGSVSLLVVDYRSGPYLRALLDSVVDEPIDEIVIVDNSGDHSTSRTLLESPARSMVVESPSNVGFGAGVNLGLVSCSSEFVAVSNPDVVVRRGAVASLRAALVADPGVALAGPALFEQNGEPHPSARAFPNLRHSSLRAFAGLLRPNGAHAVRYIEENRRRAATGIVDWVSGAFFLARRTALESVGGFDESYFLYLEEIDLCWRLARAGWSVAYEPRAEVVHVGGVSGNAHPYRMLVARHRSLARFAAKTTHGPARLALPLVETGVAARAALALALEAAHRVGAARRAR